MDADGRGADADKRAQVGNKATWRAAIRPYRFGDGSNPTRQNEIGRSRGGDHTVAAIFAGGDGDGGVGRVRWTEVALRWSSGLGKATTRCGTAR